MRSLIIFTLLLFFASCASDPIACFNIEADTLEVSESILFGNCSTNSDQYEWDFGDSTISTDIHPIHIYNDTGDYLIELKAYSNLRGNQDELIRTLKIINPSDKFIGNYLITWEGEDALLKIEYGLTVGSLLLSINNTLYCNANAEKNKLIIEQQNYWNEEFNQISHGLGNINEANDIEINIIVFDELQNEFIIHITGQKLSV